MKLPPPLVAVLMLLVAACSEEESVQAAGPPVTQNDRVLGDPNAPVTIIEYSSLGCPYCASFHANILPTIKKNFIDTGKVRLVMRDFPLGGPAYVAALMARCARPEQYFEMIEVLFQQQASWAGSEDPKKALAMIGKFRGMSQEKFDQCTNDEGQLNNIRDVQLEARQKHGVNATPTFFINGEKVSGSQPYEVFESAINEALK